MELHATFTLRFWKAAWQVFREILNYLCYVEILNGIQPRSNFDLSFSIGHRNLNSTVAHNIFKISLLKVYNAFFQKRISTMKHSRTATSGYWEMKGWSFIKSKPRRCLYISQKFSPGKSKQCQLFEKMFKFQSMCILETMQYYLDLSFT